MYRAKKQKIVRAQNQSRANQGIPRAPVRRQAHLRAGCAVFCITESCMGIGRKSLSRHDFRLKSAQNAKSRPERELAISGFRMEHKLGCRVDYAADRATGAENAQSGSLFTPWLFICKLNCSECRNLRELVFNEIQPLEFRSKRTAR